MNFKTLNTRINLIKNSIEKFGKFENRYISDEYISVIKHSDYFNEKFYRKKFLNKKFVDPAWHYLNIGWKNQFDPSPCFSNRLYLLYNPDVKKACMCPLLHFELFGKKELPARRISGVYNISSDISLDFYNKPFVNYEKVKQLNVNKGRKIEQHTKSVDIIICVHNALNDVKICLNSILKHTSKPLRIILVDDNSNESTHKFLENFVLNNKYSVLLNNNTENHGYGYSANIGLKYSTAEYIVLLNSDTIVTQNWIDKMIDCANSSENVGIVGPLSNTASWQSVPRITGDDGDWCKNEIPKDLDIDSLAQLIEKNSGYIYPKVPLINGFCMLIKRFVIDKIGYLDEENFGCGFGEEDDFNCRAKAAGIDLAICDSTYIYHAQSKSYTDRRRFELCEQSGKKLREKHGTEYISQSCHFMQNDKTLCSIRRRIQMYIDYDLYIRRGESKFSKKKIAFLLPVNNLGGGANIVIDEAKCMQRMGVDVTIINLKTLKKNFIKAYTNLNIPLIFLKSYDEILNIAKDYDAIICTHNSTVEYCDFKKQKDVLTIKEPALAYYIQDYEPYFYNENSRDYEKAKLSYSMWENCYNFTKTSWNKKIVEKETGSHCKCVGPSLDTSKFYPRQKSENDKVVITAMIRPSSKRRASDMTMKVLYNLKEKFNDLLDIRIFGCDPETQSIDGEFFNKINYNFEFTNYGIIDSYHVAALLNETNIFIDLSTFQAMGLTALEAMACGCATIVPIKGGTIDFTKNEINALVIDTTNFDENIEAITRLIENKQLRESLSKKACLDICNFYPEKAAYNILDIILD